jgi:hypothetical protein
VISISFITKREQKKLLGIVAAALTLLVPYLIHVFDHGDIEQAQSLCVFKMLTGLPCPGCGITKSLIFLYQGDLGKSLRYHLFGLPLVFCSLFLIGLFFTELLTKRDYFRSLINDRRLAYGLAIILGGYHLIRLLNFLSNNSLSDILKDSIWQ